MTNAITTVISYCSLDARFLEKCILQAGAFSKEVIVVSADHRFNGTPEDRQLLDELQIRYPLVRFIELEWTPHDNARYWHNMMRWVGKEAASTPWIMFLDADEIPEGERMRAYLAAQPMDQDAYIFSCYWYFRDATLQATKTEHCGLLIRCDLLTESMVFSDQERWECKLHPELKITDMVTDKGRSLIHHYSWVRTKAEMLQKVASWGHKHDRDWVADIEAEFSGPFKGRDFVHRYKYRRVINRFDIAL